MEKLHDTQGLLAVILFESIGPRATAIDTAVDVEPIVALPAVPGQPNPMLLGEQSYYPSEHDVVLGERSGVIGHA